MDKKKSVTKAGSSAKNTQVPALNTAKKIAPVKAGKKGEVTVKATVSRTKAASGAGKSTKTAEVKVTGKEKSPAKTKARTPGSKTELKKTPVKKPEKPVSVSKPATPEKRQVKKSPVKAAASKTGTAQGKTVKAVPQTKAAPKAEAAPKKEKKRAEKELKATHGKKSALREAPAKGTEAAIKKPKPKEKAPMAASRKGMKKKAAAAYAVHPRKEKRPKRAFDLRVFLPEEEFPEEAQLLPPPELPEEYGENELLLMEVDPSIVFASWEIKPDVIAGKTGRLILRVYDVTGIDYEEAKAGRFFDIPVGQRVDSKFFDIKMPGRDVIMEIGLLYPEGSFKAIERSHRVSMPALQNFEEFWIYVSPEDLKKPVGY